jgi:chromosome segregation ATPase
MDVQNVDEAELKLMNFDKVINEFRYHWKIDQLKNENEDYVGKNKDFEETRADQRLDHESNIEYLQTQIKEQTGKKVGLESEIKALRQRLEDMRSDHAKEFAEQRRQKDREIREKQTELEAVRERAEALEDFRIKKPELEDELTRLREELQQEKDQHEADVAEKEREKVQATEKLRRDMLYKIKETKEELLQLNET